MQDVCDIAVIGGGPGGYKCALRAAHLGLRVTCIDANSIFGGTCLREGCIPSKALLHCSHEYYKAKNDVAKFGITTEGVSFDLKTMMSYKETKIRELGKGIDYLFKKGGVIPFKGTANILSCDQGVFSVSISDFGVIKAKNVVVATGSTVTSLPNITIDEEDIVSSSSALSFSQVPKKLVVIGAGAIGLEMASIWSRLGSDVLVVEFLDRIAPAMDIELSQALLSSLKKQGIRFMLSTKVSKIEKSSGSVSLHVESATGGNSQVITADKTLVSVGRKPLIGSLFGKEVVAVDNRGFIKTDGRFETSITGVFAIGDVVGGAMLAHKAEEEGIAVAEIISGHKAHINYNIVPSVIYTHPAVSSIGKNEQQLKEMRCDYKVGKCSFVANSRARTVGETEGFVKILACKKTDVVLGVHIIGSCADTLINEASVAMTYGASAEDIYRICHSHPDFNEALKDAAEDAFLK